MDTDHYTHFFFKVGLYLAISISTCLYKEGRADRENKRRNKAAVYPPHAPDGEGTGWLCKGARATLGVGIYSKTSS